MIPQLFKITESSANSAGILWIVSWPGRGVVIKPNNFKTVWNLAWQTGAFSVGLHSATGESYTINDVGQWDRENMLEHAFNIISKFDGLVGVGFVYKEEAEQFVDSAEKYITWKRLSSEY